MEARERIDMALKEILKDAKYAKRTKGGSVQLVKRGGQEQAMADFKKLMEAGYEGDGTPEGKVEAALKIAENTKKISTDYVLDDEEIAEEWIQWKPLEGLGENYGALTLIENKKYLGMEFFEYDHELHNLEIVFTGKVYGYRNTNESYQQRAENRISKKYGGTFFHKWSFFKIENSSYIKWLMLDSDNEAPKLQHFFFRTVDEMIEVISDSEPQIIVKEYKEYEEQ